jgi:hypothetical protein
LNLPCNKLFITSFAGFAQSQSLNVLQKNTPQPSWSFRRKINVNYYLSLEMEGREKILLVILIARLAVSYFIHDD